MDRGARIYTEDPLPGSQLLATQAPTAAVRRHRTVPDTAKSTRPADAVSRTWLIRLRRRCSDFIDEEQGAPARMCSRITRRSFVVVVVVVVSPRSMLSSPRQYRRRGTWLRTTSVPSAATIATRNGDRYDQACALDGVARLMRNAGDRREAHHLHRPGRARGRGHLSPASRARSSGIRPPS